MALYIEKGANYNLALFPFWIERKALEKKWEKELSDKKPFYVT